MKRRSFLKAGAGAAIAAGGITLAYRGTTDALSSDVYVLPVADYEKDIVAPLKTAIAQLIPHNINGARCVVKPNLVELIPDAPATTHPAVLAAVCETLADLGAASVLVAEGPGHRRDISYMLRQSGYLGVIDALHLDYVDLNLDDTVQLPAPRNFTGLAQLHIPKTIADADIVVSLAKLKLHKWVGATLTMKNLFGCAPSAIYGWPKNMLHYRGIGQSILDFTDVIRPDLCIVDGIVGMEGYAPIQGDPVAHGVLIVGDQPASVDATACRLMGVDPKKIGYLHQAGDHHGPIQDNRITMRAEPWTDLAKEYQLIDQWKKIRL